MTVWILARDFTPILKAYGDENLALEKYFEHIKSRMPGLDDDQEHTEWYEDEDRGMKVRSCFYDGSFVASLTELEVQR